MQDLHRWNDLEIIFYLPHYQMPKIPSRLKIIFAGRPKTIKEFFCRFLCELCIIWVVEKIYWDKTQAILFRYYLLCKVEQLKK